MATLVPCRDCGYEVSSGATTCPKCGRFAPGSKDKEKASIAFGIGLLLGVIVLFLLFA